MSATVGVWNAQGLEHADTALLERVRDGDCDAYGQLWRRHLPSAYAVANRYRGRACAEDIVGEASLRVYDRIRAGTGPTSNFRSYFLSTVKTVAIDLVRAELRLVPTQPDDLEDACAPAPPYNPALRVDQDLVRVAFGRLTEREQHLLWRTAVEGTPPTVLAPTMGLSANAVSVAALRARESLRGHYLDAYADRAVQRANSEECRWVLTRIGRYVRDDLRASHRSRIERHLQQCRHANVVLAELSEVNRALPALMVALIFVGGSGGAGLWAATGLPAGEGHGDAPTAASTGHSGSPAATAATATSGAALVKVVALTVAGALGAALITAAPTASDGPALADRDHTQRASGPSLPAGPTELALGSSALQAAGAQSSPESSTGPALVDVTAAAVSTPGQIPQPPAPNRTAEGPASISAVSPGAVTGSATTASTTPGPPATRPVPSAATSSRSNQQSTGSPTPAKPTPPTSGSPTPTPAKPTPPTAGSPPPPPGLRGLSIAIANVTAQKPQANSKALTALQN
ncbi:MAG: sigma-70 family RNA polymerase sigma factor, partial [Dermatophilaceae bacterium]